ncbi:alkylmercury lyase family protein [Microvirga sp. VF16]|uniref:alkylmercury lyase family protein n=1 Tax=Microvirga sp. VF16 TaxID=2807101 RepID=UPI00193D3AFE|nr:alkylmercury lyase family protein [Microvirga sp. VF16]QRM34717.1 alkylmercury lyase family protein [Microvirga sp. VF16]
MNLTPERAAEIRPGVLRPDWSAVTTSAARETLRGRMAARSGLLDKWSHALEASEDIVWRTVLHLYAAKGRPPTINGIAATTGMGASRVAALLRELQLRDLVGLEAGSDAIWLAYPFTERATGHRVELNGHSLNALCAIDALGVAAMYGTDVMVTSQCRSCGETIRVMTADAGRTLQSVSHPRAGVWYDFAYADSAASSCCPAIAFFCSDAHLQRWLDSQAIRPMGARLNLDEALEVGHAIFGPVLREPAPAVA